MENKKYKVVIAQSGKLDVKEKKKYILQQFKYREYAENFSKKIKKAVLALDTLPTGYNTTGFRYRGYDIYMKPWNPCRSCFRSWYFSFTSCIFILLFSY